MKKNILLSALLTGTLLIVTNSHAVDLGIAEKHVMDTAIKQAEQIAKGHLPALERKIQEEIKKTGDEIESLRNQIKAAKWVQKVKLKIREAYLVAKKGFLSGSLAEVKRKLGVK